MSAWHCVRVFVLYTVIGLSWFGILMADTPAGLPGNFWLLTIGATLNGIVVAANGLRMPVRGHPDPESLDGIHTVMTGGSRLPWLADIIPVKIGVISIGDVLVLTSFVLGLTL